MELYSSNDSYKLYKGNMLDMLEVISPNSIDSIITDPPYELNFMNRSWDNSGIAFNKDAWKKCYDVIKPGGYLLAFGGSRTFHRIACAIEDAGFEIRDVIMWLYGSAMPKGLNIGYAVDKRNGVESIDTGMISPASRPSGNKDNNLYKLGTVGKNFTIKIAQNEWRGWNTQLKPSYEPIIVAQKPIEKSIVDNVIKYGVGGLNIDECKIGKDVIKGGTMPKMNGGDLGVGNFKTIGSDRIEREDTFGRYPANVIHDGSDEVVKLFPNSKSSGSDYNFESSNQNNTTHLYTNIKSGKHFDDEGSCARFFYCAKASQFDRDEGLDDFEFQKNIRINAPREKEEDKFIPRKNTHVTVKPTNLMRYLVRLVSPKGATILDCFNGSGSTGKAVMLENKQYNKDYKYIGIELTDEYLPIAKARIEYIINNDFDFSIDENGRSEHEVVKKDNRITIFDFEN